jgi:hypothetical protein
MQAPPPAETKVREFAKEYHVTDHDFPRQLLNHSDIPSDEEDPIYIENLMSGSKQISNYEIANIYRQQMIPIDQWDMETRAWFKNWDRWMVETGNMDFTRWLEVARDIRPLPAQQAILVDEAQDHTPLQLAVIRNWNARNRILIGDDDQNLYEWAGALPEAFFEVDIPAKNERVLSQSYRVPRMVHAEASKLLGYLKRRHPKVYMPRDADGEFKRSNYTLLDAEIGSLPEDLLTNPDESYMILTSCAYMQEGLIKVLREQGIPFHNPYRRSNKKWNPLGSAWNRLRNYKKVDHWTGGELHSWASQLKATGVYQPGLRDIFLSFCKEHAEDNIPMDFVYRAFLPGAIDQISKRDLNIFANMRKTGSIGSWEYAIGIMKKYGPDHRPKLTIGTIHSVKGGQADHVYLFPDLSWAGAKSLGDNTEYKYERIIRLFYVGMTRARESLTLCSSYDLNSIKL